MAESKLTQDLAELAEQCLDREEEEALFKLEAEAARRPILVPVTTGVEVEATDERSWSPIRGAVDEVDERPAPDSDDEGAKMSSRGSLPSVADMAELAGCIETAAADNLRSASSLLLLVESSSSPHNRFISSSTRKKSSSLAEAIEHAIRQ